MIGLDVNRLPAGWALSPLDSVSEVVISNVDKKDYADQQRVKLCNYTDVYYREAILDRDDYMPSTASPEQIERFTVQRGDVAITKDSETADDIGRPSYAPDSIPGLIYGYHLAIYRPFDKRIGRFIRYLFESLPVRAELHARTPGVTRVGLSMDTLRNLRVPLPTPSLATQIADYLDHETAEFDKLIADLQSFDTIYTERQMAQVSDLIAYPADLSTSHACASGIVKAKYQGDIALGKMLDARQEDPDSTTHPYLRAANVQPMGKLALEDIKHMRFTHREAAHLTIRGGDVLVVEGGVGGYGRAAYVSEDIPETGFQNSILRLRPHAHADGRFITYALLLLRHRGYMKMAASVTSMPHFTVDKLANTPIPLMNLTRQTEIADELDAMWQRVDAVRDEGKRAVALARERRAALITAAVTGQIDVTARHKPAAEQLEDDIAQGLHREN